MKSETIKTHSGLISAFGQHVVKAGAVPVAVGKSLSKVSEIRLIADYSDEEVDRQDTEWVLAQSAAFISAIDTLAGENGSR